MVSKFLLPNRFKLIGWVLLIPSFILGILWLCDIRYIIQAPVFSIWGDKLLSIIHKDIYNELVSAPLLISLLMITFAREKNEDEYISKIRLDSLVWAIYINYILLFISILFVFQGAFYTVMIFNLFTILILFIIRFNIVLYKSKRQMDNEK
ncbi:MAG: hypothetical protein HZB41_10720 [Ignavibacteriae bacterium]|nr:hypothetical protein [Ignavibacteriota bacterium]